MHDSRFGLWALAGLVSTLGCLNLGTQTPATGGAGGEGGTGESSSSGGMGGTAGSGGGATCADCQFGRRYGDDATQTMYNMAMDGEGSVYLTGTYDGAIFFGSNVGLVDEKTNVEEAFLVKIDTHGTPQWAIKPTDAGTTSGIGSSISIENQVVAWGGHVGDTSNLRDIFVEIHSLASGPNVLIRKTFGSQWHDELASLALSTDAKTVYVAGILYGSATEYQGCPQVGSFDAGMNPNIVVLALDTASLNCKWGKTWTGGNHNSGTIRIAVAGDGNPVLTGAYSSGTLLGTGLPSGDGAFAMKLDATSGNMLVAKGFPNVYPLAMTVDRSTDSIVISGALTGSLTFAGVTAGNGIPQGSNHIAILAYDKALQEKWFRPLIGNVGGFCQGISTNGAGRLYAGCLHQGSLAVPNGPSIECPASVNMCGLLVTLNSADGTVLGDKCKAYGPDQPAQAGATFLTGANTNALVMGGSWIAPITFPDGMTLAPNGGSNDYDLVVGKVDPAP